MQTAAAAVLEAARTRNHPEEAALDSLSVEVAAAAVEVDVAADMSVVSM